MCRPVGAESSPPSSSTRATRALDAAQEEAVRRGAKAYAAVIDSFAELAEVLTTDGTEVYSGRNGQVAGLWLAISGRWGPRIRERLDQVWRRRSPAQQRLTRPRAFRRAFHSSLQ